MKRRGGTGRAIEFLAVGHVTVDSVGHEARLGGAAAYASLTAARLGLASGIVTSAGADFPFWSELTEVEAHYEEAPATTTFENAYADGSGERRQRILAEAAPLTGSSIASVRARLAVDAAVLYCPVAHELPTLLALLSPKGLSAVAPQGFFRQWDESGFVESADWEDAATELSSVDVVSMSEKDHPAPEEMAEDFAGRAFAVTKGGAGVRIYSRGDIYDLPAFAATEIDPTGAGDVFAAAFLVALREGRPVPEAGRFACCAASFAVEAPGAAGIPTRSQVESRLAERR